MHPMMNVAIKAARSAGNIMNRASLNLERLQVARKQQNDFVTEVDRAVEYAVIEVLRESYPSHHILAEESGYLNAEGESLGLLPWDEVVRLQQEDPEEHFLWVIDPIDGTTNFIHGFPQFAVSIALFVNGVVQQGVIYDPNRDELFTATKGAGAYLNHRRLRVASQLRLTDCLLGTGFPYRDDQDLDRSLDLAYVAAGRLDGFFEGDLKPWDMAAGVLLVQEAGGLVGQYDGEEGYYSSGQIMAANPKIFAQMAQVLSKF
jgi:myo-inositol-1(or 4)-monophosphatase